uniref:Tryptophan synthase beta chain-like PALP domain-containing protein n=1 Tax=Hyaloperonospora arabidopsidis (strain Emoy2) TaxID=559515 RepID=M4C533_HYAAE
MSRIPLPLRRHGLYVAPAKHFSSRSLSILSSSNEQLGQKHQVTATTVDLLASVGNTPLLELPTLSKLTGCKLVAKAEYTNPSGSIKDRVAKSLILDAEERGMLEPGGTIIEATGGSTGVSLALLGASRGYKTLLTMPDITASEKVQMMKVMGAQVRVLPTTCISDKNHFFNVARCLAETTANAYCPNQFDNTANMRAHYDGTAPEIWTQIQGGIHGFVTSAGTSGTIAGMSKFFKERNPDVKVWLIDPEETASMSAFINNDRSTSSIENGFEIVPMAGGWTIAEGVAALSRVTNNLRESIVDHGITATNQEIVDMSYFLLRNDGIFVGPSSALNVLGAVKMALELGPGHTIVTILADGGVRYGSKLYNEAWLKDHDLLPQEVNKKGSPSLDFVRSVRFPTTV